jgi:hypothetical protein
MAQGAVDGTVMNRTTAKPQPDATVTLYRLGEAGMDSLESVKSDAMGAFHIDRTPQGPHLIQIAYDGVTYNHMLSPGSPATGLTLEVFNSSTRRGSAKVVQHMVLLEPVDNQLHVSENVIFQNDGRLAYNDPDNGTLRIFLPEEAGGQARVMARAPNGMPIQRAAQKTNRPEVYKIDFPIKPGETRFDVSYVLPFSSPSVFSGRALHGDAPIRLIAPAGVSLAGEGLESLGQEPHTQAKLSMRKTLGLPSNRSCRGSTTRSTGSWASVCSSWRLASHSSTAAVQQHPQPKTHSPPHRKANAANECRCRRGCLEVLR